MRILAFLLPTFNLLTSVTISGNEINGHFRNTENMSYVDLVSGKSGSQINLVFCKSCILCRLQSVICIIQLVITLVQ